MKVKEESEKVCLTLNIQKTKIMASGPITSWEIDGETVAHFTFGGSKITADGDCSHEIKRCLLLGRSRRLLISWLQSPSSVILEPPKVKCAAVSTVSPSISHEVTGPDAMPPGGGWEENKEQDYLQNI